MVFSQFLVVLCIFSSREPVEAKAIQSDDSFGCNARFSIITEKFELPSLAFDPNGECRGLGKVVGNDAMAMQIVKSAEFGILLFPRNTARLPDKAKCLQCFLAFISKSGVFVLLALELVLLALAFDPQGKRNIRLPADRHQGVAMFIVELDQLVESLMPLF